MCGVVAVLRRRSTGPPPDAGALAAATDGGAPGDAALDAYWSVHVALSAIDRLEVRGRDSAGVHLLVTGHRLDPSDPEIARRAGDQLFRSGSVRLVPDPGRAQ